MGLSRTLKGVVHLSSKYSFWIIYRLDQHQYLMHIHNGILYECAATRKSKPVITVHGLTRTSQCLLVSERFQQTFYYFEASVLDKPAVYRIKVRGVVPESWVDRLGEMQIVAVSSIVTTLEGGLPDQAALKGVLDTLYELRCCIEEVTCL
jgi:hypothetical protein